MPINADHEIEELYEDVRLLSEEKQAQAILLLAMQVGILTSAVLGVKSSVDGISQSIGIVLDHDDGAIRTTDKPKAR